ncbi:MAG: hypothetical protein JWN44_5038 [Myxococcales bacterium]|nr:hypothetical protein [Myxococcales bacterium]
MALQRSGSFVFSAGCFRALSRVLPRVLLPALSLLLLTMLTLGGCEDDLERGGVADLGTPAGPGADLAETPATAADLSTPPPPADLAATADDLAAPQGPTPFVVDDTFAASGHEGGGDVPGTVTDDETCAARAGGGRGRCHHISWTPGTNSWGGVVWQYPVDNWGADPGFAVPAGYGQVRFWAWGKDGGEQVSFLVGLGVGGPDKFQQRLDVKLTAQPKLYVLGVRGAYGDKVVSAFGWVTGAAAAQTFYVDDVVWDGGAAASAPASFGVDTKFGPSGYMGDGAGGFVTHGACASPSGGSTCHHYVWDPNADAGGNSQGWAGVFWQSAPGNWAGATDPDGAAVATGYGEVRFWAWSASGGGETVSFLAGMGVGTRDGWQSKLDVRLNATPTLYTLGVGGGYGAHVAGGFGWVAGGSGLRFNIDGATWK